MKPTNTITLDVNDVWCPRCGSPPGAECVSTVTGEGMGKHHPERATERKRLTTLATGTTPNNRWWRWRIRQAGAPRPPIVHNTEAGYQQHRRDGTTPCRACTEAAQAAWRERKREQTAREASE